MVLPTPPSPRAFPKCAKCGHKEFSAKPTTFKKTNVLIIYCDSCGAVAGVVNAKAE